MWKGITILLAAAVATVGCSHGVSRIRTHALPSPNPTSYSFPMPAEEVHAKALQAFSRDRQYKEPIFKQAGKTENWRETLLVESSTNNFSKMIFNDSANAHDILLNADGTPVVISEVYRGRNGGLPFFAKFHLHLAGTGPETVVSVQAFEARVVNGKRYGCGSCGPGWHWNYKTVAPTTVEEYTVLSYLGRHLGSTNMPVVVLPADSN